MTGKNEKQAKGIKKSIEKSDCERKALEKEKVEVAENFVEHYDRLKKIREENEVHEATSLRMCKLKVLLSNEDKHMY